MTIDLDTLRSKLEDAITSRPADPLVALRSGPTAKERELIQHVISLPELERRQLNAMARSLRYGDAVLVQYDAVQPDDTYVITLSLEEFDAGLALLAGAGLVLGDTWA